MRSIALMLLVLPLATLATAQDEEAQSNRRVKYAERTEIDFTGIEVTAGWNKPEGELVVDRIALEFPPMIDLRADFTAEMQGSLDAVK